MTKLAVNKVCATCPFNPNVDPDFKQSQGLKTDEKCKHVLSRFRAADLATRGLGITVKNIADAINPPAELSINSSTLADEGTIIENGQPTFIIKDNKTPLSLGKFIIDCEGTIAELSKLITHVSPTQAYLAVAKNVYEALNIAIEDDPDGPLFDEILDQADASGMTPEEVIFLSYDGGPEYDADTILRIRRGEDPYVVMSKVGAQSILGIFMTDKDTN